MKSIEARGKVKCIPIVGMVVTISPSFSLYRMVVFPAASRPTINILISFLPQSLSKSFENVRPMIAVVEYVSWWKVTLTLVLR